MPTRISDEAESNSYYLSKLDSHYVNQIGDTMSGELNMNENKITNVGIPITSGDAVNKGYVDSKFPRIYYFKLVKVITPEDKVTRITVLVPNGVSPGRVYLEASHSYLKSVSRSVSESGSHSITSVTYLLKFTLLNELQRTIDLVGKIFILPLEPIRLLGSSVVVNLVNESPVVEQNTTGT